MTDLERDFGHLMMSIYNRAKKEAGYPANIFLRMLGERGPLETARYLLREPQVSSGFVALYGLKRLDLTVEAQLLANPRFWPLFDQQDLDTARRWLKEYCYEVE
jgi:hypothetical protein